MKFKSGIIFLKGTIIFLLSFILLCNSIAQGPPPPVKGSGSAPAAQGPEPPPGGGGSVPLDSNAIYVLLAGGLLFLLYTNRKKILTITVKSDK
jgi:hypothetical protein